MSRERLLPVPGTGYVVLAGDARASREVYERRTLLIDDAFVEVCRPHIKPGAVVLDVGAFIGYATAAFLSLGARRVHAFEPYPDAAEAWHENVAAFARADVDRYVGSLATLIDHPIGDGAPLAASGEFGEPDNCGTRLTVRNDDALPSLRIDTLALPRVDFCKLDLEGNEPRALDGMADTLRRCRPALLVEAYDVLLARQGFTRAGLLMQLDRLGYNCRVAIGHADEPRVDYLCEPRGGK